MAVRSTYCATYLSETGVYGDCSSSSSWRFNHLRPTGLENFHCFFIESLYFKTKKNCNCSSDFNFFNKFAIFLQLSMKAFNRCLSADLFSLYDKWSLSTDVGVFCQFGHETVRKTKEKHQFFSWTSHGRRGGLWSIWILKKKSQIHEKSINIQIFGYWLIS